MKEDTRIKERSVIFKPHVPIAISIGLTMGIVIALVISKKEVSFKNDFFINEALLRDFNFNKWQENDISDDLDSLKFYSKYIPVWGENYDSTITVKERKRLEAVSFKRRGELQAGLSAKRKHSAILGYSYP